MSKSPSLTVQNIAEAIAKDCVAMRIRYLNRSLTSIYDDAFRPLGITASQVNMLVALIRQASLSPGELGRLFNMEKSTISRNLERMRKAGWIEITTSGRTHAIKATPEGKQLLVDLMPHWEEAQKAADALLGSDGSQAIREFGDHARDQQINT
jgi:DNA-binding MarR family transcriptional regulator